MKSISILCPTRGRPTAARDHYESALSTAKFPLQVQFVFRVDADDSSMVEDIVDFTLGPDELITGPRTNSADLFNQCAAVATGDILMMGGDDMRFRTQDWDEVVRAQMWDDGIGCLYPDDGATGNCVHPIIGREMYDALGFFSPPGYNWAYIDTWLHDVSRRIGRAQKIDILCEHLHFSFGKSEMDETYAYRRRDDCEEINDDHHRWEWTEDERKAAAEELRGLVC